MSTRAAVIAGLLSGVVAAVALLVALVTLGPDPGVPPPTPPVLPTAGASGAPTGVAAPTAFVPTPPVSAAPSPGSANFHVGQQAPPLAVPQVGGGTIDLATLRGQPVWVNFMATWCPPCIDEFPLMNSFAARYANDGLVVIAVDVREDEGTVATFAQRLNATFPIGLDSDGSAQDDWRAYAMPVHFWVDAEGVVRYGAAGGIGPDIMVTGLEAILPGVEVTP